MKELKQLFNKHYTSINNLEYIALYHDSLDGYISILSDIELEELLYNFIDVSINDIKVALYNGTLSLYKRHNTYIAVLES